MDKEGEREYLGDGVYARYDGYYVHLAVNNHMNEVVAIEPFVLERLNQFYNNKKSNDE